MDSPVISASDVIYDRMQVTPQQLADFCQTWQIAELAVFGSVLRDDFRSEGQDRSDIDVLFTYAAQARRNLLRQIRMQFELEALWQCPVDLVSKTAVLADPNQRRRENILSAAKTIYVSAQDLTDAQPSP